jgi:predicted MFS family arabinose efflux permease
MFGVWNSHTGFGVFLPVLSGEFGWSRGAISIAASLNLIVGGVIAFVVGAASDRYGPRPVLALSALMIGAVYLLASTISTLWQFYLLMGVLLGISMSGIYLVPTATVARWFVKQRGLALGILLAGLNLSLVTGGPLSASLIENFGWRASYQILGVLVWTIATPASLFTRFPDGQTKGSSNPSDHRPDGESLRDALRNRRLWLIAAAWFLLGFAHMMITIHVVPFVKDRGVMLERASLALTIFGIGTIIGRILLGTAADRLGTMRIFWACQIVQIVALTWILTGPSLSTLYSLILWFGVGAAGSDTAVVKGSAEVFGTRAIGAIMGALSFGWRCGAALGPAAAGFIYDATGSYTIALGLASAGLAGSTIFFTLATLPLRNRAAATL